MDNYLGQIMCVAFNFAPKYWVICAGQLLPIAQNQALFSLLGTVYGGDGRITFGLPDLRGRCAISSGKGNGLPIYTLGEKAGEEGHLVNIAEMTAHFHLWKATATTGTLTTGSGNVLGGSNQYFKGAANGNLSPAELPNAGGSQPHENRSPSVAMTWIIALSGIFPSRD